MASDLEELLADARAKTNAESAVSELRCSLRDIDISLTDLGERRSSLVTQVEKARGVFGRLRRDNVDENMAALEIARIDSAMAEFTDEQSLQQGHLRERTKDAAGAELARAKLGAEMQRRTKALEPNGSTSNRLAQVDHQREELVAQRSIAISVAELAAELVLWVDAAEKADDGTDVLFVELRSAAQRAEEFQRLLSSDFHTRRTLVKDRLEGFRALHAPPSDYPTINELLALASEDHRAEPQVWLHRVRTTLNAALDNGLARQAETQQSLILIDDERVALLSAG